VKSIRGERAKTAREETLMVYVDVGKTSIMGYCTMIDVGDIELFRFDNTREGLDKLWSTVVASRDTFKCTEVVVAYESTSPHAEPLVRYLLHKPVTLVPAFVKSVVKITTRRLRVATTV
jgi:hypothetical protein